MTFSISNTQAAHALFGLDPNSYFGVHSSLGLHGSQQVYNFIKEAHKIIVPAANISELNISGGTFNIKGTTVNIAQGSDLAAIIAALETNITISAIEDVLFVEDEGAIAIFAKDSFSVTLLPPN